MKPPLTNDDAIARALDMISTIETLSDGLAQRNAAQTMYYISSLYEMELLTKSQFEVLINATDSALRDWEVEQSRLEEQSRLA